MRVEVEVLGVVEAEVVVEGVVVVEVEVMVEVVVVVDVVVVVEVVVVVVVEVVVVGRIHLFSDVNASVGTHLTAVSVISSTQAVTLLYLHPLVGGCSVLSTAAFIMFPVGLRLFAFIDHVLLSLMYRQ